MGYIVRMDPVNEPAKFEVRSIYPSLKFWAVPGYVVQGHPWSLILVLIERAYATSY